MFINNSCVFVYLCVYVCVKRFTSIYRCEKISNREVKEIEREGSYIAFVVEML